MKKNVMKYGAMIAVMAAPLLAFAQTGPQPAGTGGTPINTPSATINTAQGVLNFLCTIFGWMFYFLIALAVIFVIVAAFKYLTASGNPEKVKGATNTILYAAIAVAVALLALGVPNIVSTFLGASGSLGTCGSSSSTGGVPNDQNGVGVLTAGQKMLS